jgi:uncharacterized protein (DUF169 family)
MNLQVRDRFLEGWERYFGAAELPITFYYTDAEGRGERHLPAHGHECVLAPLAKVRHGRSLQLDLDSVGCWGGKRYLGFSQAISPTFDYFLSCGIPGKVEGERYKQSPELVREYVRNTPGLVAPARSIVFKRWDRLEAEDTPAVVIFFARPDVLAGLFTLANFDEPTLTGVVAPFAAGCGSIVAHPYLEGCAETPRAVLGMFDVSARPYVPPETLSFAVPMQKFIAMAANMDESFLITPSWRAVQKRFPDI